MNFLVCGWRTEKLCWPSSSRFTWVSIFTCLYVCLFHLSVCSVFTSSFCVFSGVKGQVFDDSGVPLQNAVVEVKGRSNLSPFRSDKHGEYYRLLLPGNYSFTVNLILLKLQQ